MSLTAKQERFAREYVVDLNASAAARRAGYSPRTARQLGSRNLQHPGVQQLIAKLTASKFEELGIEQGESVFWTKQLWEMSAVVQPKIWKGPPISFSLGFTGYIAPRYPVFRGECTIRNPHLG